MSEANAIPTEEMSLVKCLKHYFEMDGSTLIRDFKKLTDKDKADFEEMLRELGYKVTRA